jgi:hypothetical protein
MSIVLQSSMEFQYGTHFESLSLLIRYGEAKKRVWGVLIPVQNVIDVENSA